MDKMTNTLGFLEMEAAITWVMLKENRDNERMKGYFEGVSAALTSLVGMDAADEHYLNPDVLEELFAEHAFNGYCGRDEDGKIFRY